MSSPVFDRSPSTTPVARSARLNISRESGPHEPPPSRQVHGHFASSAHTQAALTRRFKLYTPPSAGGASLPLVVMLHGCMQTPDDFAAGTAMNEAACEIGFYVLYPEQSKETSPSLCWNWFKHNHQQRGRGEPALIASLTQTVMAQHRVDPARVYIAGLSAGGAMAAIVAAAYPEIYAAVAVHSGLPSGAASDAAGAVALMRTGVAGAAVQANGQPAAIPGTGRRVPTIVFHGDQDPTVHPRNGERVIAAALAGAPADSEVEHGVSTLGRRYTREIHRASSIASRGAPLGQTLAEHWVVHGSGHAWSGGQASGSFTDARGPDATREILRFFFEQAHRTAAAR